MYLYFFRAGDTNFVVQAFAQIKCNYVDSPPCQKNLYIWNEIEGNFTISKQFIISFGNLIYKDGFNQLMFIKLNVNPSWTLW